MATVMLVTIRDCVEGRASLEIDDHNPKLGVGGDGSHLRLNRHTLPKA